MGNVEKILGFPSQNNGESGEDLVEKSWNVSAADINKEFLFIPPPEIPLEFSLFYRTIATAGLPEDFVVLISTTTITKTTTAEE